MAENPYESPIAPSSLDRRRRQSRRWPWHYKIALAFASTILTIVFLFAVSEFMLLADMLHNLLRR